MKTLALLGFCLLVLLGCGGSGRHTSHPGGALVRLSVEWPQAGRMIHARTDRVSVIVSAGDRELSVVNIDKEPNTSVGSLDLTIDAPTGAIDFDIRAFEKANPSEILSRTHVRHVLVPGVNELGFTLASVIDRVAVQVSKTEFAVGETVSYSILGYAEGRIVLDRPSDFELRLTGDTDAVQLSVETQTLTGLRDGRLFAVAREAGSSDGRWSDPVELRVGNGIEGGAFFTAEGFSVPGATQTVFRGVNAQGDAVGLYTGGGPHGQGGFVRRSSGEVMLLNPPTASITGAPPVVTGAAGIDGAGNVLGNVAEGGNTFIAVWSDYGATLRYYGRMGSGVNGNEALAMNSRGDILTRWFAPFQGVGTRIVPADPSFAYASTVPIDGNGMGLSDDGTVLSAVIGGPTGVSYYATPFGGVAQLIQKPAGVGVRVIAANAALLGMTSAGAAVYWATPFGPPQELAWHGEASDISSSGRIVGWSQELGLWGFLAELDGSIVSLDDRITGMPSEVHSLSPVRILEDGRIFATGSSTSGNEAIAVALTPAH